MQFSILYVLGVSLWTEAVAALPNPNGAVNPPCTKTMTRTRNYVWTPRYTTTSTVVVNVTATADVDTITAFSSTLVGTNTITVTVNANATTTTTTTTTIDGGPLSTTTVAAPVGFVPVQNALQDSSCDHNCGSIPDLSDRGLNVKKRNTNACDTRLLIHTRTTSTADTTTTFTHTTTVNSTVATVTPTKDVTKAKDYNTKTTTTSTQFETTITRTSTATTTTYDPVVTEYAACAPDNFADTVNGKNITEIGIISSNAFNDNWEAGIVTYPNIASPYDCCVQGLTDGTSNLYSVFSWALNGQCTLNVVSSGAPAGQFESFWVDGLAVPHQPEIVIGNLYYGSVMEIV